MVTRLPGQPHVSDLVLSKIHKGAAILNLAELHPFSGSNEGVFYTFNGSDAEYHSGTDTTDKKISDDQLSEVTIRTKTLYKWLEFSDEEFQDLRVIANAIENKTPYDLYRTLDKDAVGGKSLVPTSGFDGYTATPLEVGATAASWLDAVDAVSDNGYEATGIILDNSFRKVLRAAFVENTNTNQLGTSIRDGIYVGDVPVFFRNLGAGVGVVGDFSQFVVAYNNNLNVVHYDPNSDAYQGRRDKNAVKVSWRVGVGVATQDAFQPITLAASGE